MKTYIADWTARPTSLRIRIATEPLSMSKDYVWVYHTTNHYGQGAKYAWWHYNGDKSPDISVYGDEANDLLTSLVRGTPILNLLADHYKIPE